MGYLHIGNLYKNQSVLMLRECYALEKIHGTSAHIRYADGRVHYSSGGEKHERFVDLFDQSALLAGFSGMGHSPVVVYGEAYGGKQQKQSHRYGPQLRFVVFEVQIGGLWLAVPQAEDVAGKLGLEFVHYVRCSTDLSALDEQRDAPSEQARRNGVDGEQTREGIVIRPLVELVSNNGRLIAKHKRDDERETRTPRSVVDPARLEVLTKAQEIADEWVTPTRLEHVLDKMGPGVGIERMRDVLVSMLDDVLREGAGEIVDSREARSAIKQNTAALFKKHLRDQLAGERE